MDASRRSFLKALLATPLIAQLQIHAVLAPEFSLAEFAKKCVMAGKSDLFIVSEALYRQVLKALKPEDMFLRTDWAQGGFDHVLFHGKPVLYYPDDEREEFIQIIAQYADKKDRLDISEIKV